MSLCPDCMDDASLGAPSYARWLAPNREDSYCSLHFIRRYGHAERLVPVEGYEPPAERKPPAPRQAKATTVRKGEVSA